MADVRLDPRQVDAARPNISVWVSANAGAGKTQVLVNRIARLLLAGVEPANILCLTYTNAGAAEMADRIYKTLGAWAGLADADLKAALQAIGISSPSAGELERARRLFALALDTPGGFKIQTIHGFCERILQLFPIEAGLAPGFTILDDNRKADLLKQARDSILTDAQVDAGSELAKALELVSRHASVDSLETLIDEMRDKASRSGGWPDNAHAGLIDAQLRRFFSIDSDVSLRDLRQAALDADYDGLVSCADMLASGGVRNQTLGQKLKAVAAEQDPDQRLRLLAGTLIAEGQNGLQPATVYKTEPAGLQAKVRSTLEREFNRLLPLMQRHDELLRIEATKALATISAEVLKRYRDAKAHRAAYDFNDLIDKARQLLTDASSAAWVLYKLDKAVEHVLIDEAQDTSPPQWQIMQAITDEFYAGEGRERKAVRTLFVVGDQKQSIFSFQGADVRIFASSRSYYEDRIRASRQEMHTVPLTISYRSQQPVLDAVDAVFKEGTPARLSLGIAGVEGLTHVAQRPEQGGLVELWPLMIASDKIKPELWRAAQQLREQQSPQRLLARHIADTIASWIDRRWHAARGRTVQPGDILLLFRSRNRMFDLLITALREAGVPVAGTDRLQPTDSIAVQDMLALIRVVTLPADDYALACVLKSPLVSKPLNEEQLFDLCYERGAANLWERLAASKDEAALSCLAELSHWRSLAQELRAYEFISHLLRLRKPDIVSRLGGEAGDALKALVEQALAYEREHGASLTGFAEWFRSETGEIKRDMDPGQGEVRLMTVHGAKGLEADIVMLPDAADYRAQDRDRLMFVSADGGLGDTPLWKVKDLIASPAIERLKSDIKLDEHGEYTRLLYVAMTRARDELYICGASDKDMAPDKSWYAMASAALLKADGFREADHPAGGKVWRCGVDPQWARGTPATVSLPPALEIPACLTDSNFPKTVAPPRAFAPSRMANPDGRTFDAKAARTGRIFHRLLEILPDKPVPERRGFVRRYLERNGLDASHAERLLAVLEMPEMQALFAPASRAEVGIGAPMPGGAPLTGVIDRLIVRERDVLLIDYKSDAIVPSRTEPDHPHYQQMAGYCFAMQKLYPGKDMKAGILWLSTLRLDWLDPTEMAGSLASLRGEPSLA